MKKKLLVVLLAGALAVLWCSSLYAQWEPDFRLTYDPAYSWTSENRARCVAAGASGDVHVVWQDQRDKPLDPTYWEVYYKRSTDGGLTWEPDTRLTFHYPNLNGIALTPSVAVSGPYVHVVWDDTRDGNSEIYYCRSTDGGATWGPNTRLTFEQHPSHDPSVAASGQRVHVAWKDQRAPYETIWYKGSNDTGVTWSTDFDLTPFAPSANALHPSVSAMGNIVHVVWQDNHINLMEYDIYYKRSMDGGTSWKDTKQLTDHVIGQVPQDPCVSSSSPFVHVVWSDYRWGNDNYEIYYEQSTDYGETWPPLGQGQQRLTNDPGNSKYPSITASAHNVHLVWDDNVSGTYNQEIYYKCSTDDGTSWKESRLTYNETTSDRPHVSVAGSEVHVVWKDIRDGGPGDEIYYKRNPSGNPFIGFQTEPSQGRHLARDPLTGNFHLVMASQDNKVYYTKSVDGFTSWSEPVYLGDGKYPTLCVLYGMTLNPILCMAYKPTSSNNSLIYMWYDTVTGELHTYILGTGANSNPGPPSIVSDGYTVTVVYRAYVAGFWRVQSKRFAYFNPSGAATQNIDASGSPEQPCLAVDGAGDVHAAWRRATENEIYYSKRRNGVWWTPEKIYSSPAYLSTQPFVECYGESVYVVWTEGENSPSDVRRARRRNVYPPPLWDSRNVSNSSDSSVSPTQAWREFTTWSEATPTPWFDINYWRPSGMTGVVESNPAEWSYWTHSQMSYFEPDLFTHLWSAWTERDNANPPHYRVLTKHTSFPFFGPGLGGELSDYGSYYNVLAGQDTASVYCLKRDGLLRFADKAVDFSRDSLVYELPYLDPVYDYYLKVYSYRETGENWAQGLSFAGGPMRTVQFASNRVDTIRVRIPPELYVQDRKVVLVLKNLRGDYVPALGLTLFQRDPKPRGMNGGGQGGGGQAGVPVSMPYREVFAVYPNPTNSQTQIEYSLQVSGQVDLAVYDVMGRLVRQLVRSQQPAGVHRVAWDGKTESGERVSSGIYFVKLNAPGTSKTARFVVVR